MRRTAVAAVLAACGLWSAAGGSQPGAWQALFSGKDLAGWKLRDGAQAAKKSHWQVVGGVRLDPADPGRFVAEPGAGVLLNGGDGRGVDLLLDMTHGDCELHVEFNVPRGSNSGIYLHGQYEVQVLDSHGKAAADLKYGDCGGIYNTAPPRLNACYAPGEWQAFDVWFQAPRFDDKGNKTANACFLKVIHNGRVIHENVEVMAPTTSALGGPERPQGVLMLQGDHGPVAYRNIRLKPLERK